MKYRATLITTTTQHSKGPGGTRAGKADLATQDEQQKKERNTESSLLMEQHLQMCVLSRSKHSLEKKWLGKSKRAFALIGLFFFLDLQKC